MKKVNLAKNKEMIDQLKKIIKGKDNEIKYLSDLIKKKNADITQITDQLNVVLNTFRWRLINRIFKFIEKTRIFSLFKKKQQRKVEKKILQVTDKQVYFNPYQYVQILKPIEIVVINENFIVENIKQNFSMVITTKNEEKTIGDFLKQIEAQSLLPDEVIITDGGSTDHTISEIEKVMKRHILNIKLIKGRIFNIPQGRNNGIKQAQHDIIVIADAGNSLNRNYCSDLVGSLIEHKADLAGGIYYPAKKTSYSNFFLVDWDKTDWDSFLPSTRVLIIKKTLAERCGYFPEYVNSGDDTLFDINYRRLSTRWVFNKAVKVLWESPSSIKQYTKVALSYGKADGEDGIGEYFYSELKNQYKNKLPLVDTELRKEQFKGFLEGRIYRPQVDVGKRKIKGVVLVLGYRPFYEIRKNAKIISKIAEYENINFKIFYINFSLPNKKNEKKKYFNLDFSLIELIYINDLDIEFIIKNYAQKLTKLVIIQEVISKEALMIVNMIKRSFKETKIIKVPKK